MIVLRNLVTWGLAGALVLAAGTAAIEHARRLRADRAAAEAQADLQAYRATQEEAGRLAERAQRAEEGRREDEIRKVVDDARKENLRALGDAAAARAAGDSLRIALAAARARGCAAGSGAAAAEGGQAAGAPADLLADVQRRLDEAADGIAAHADAALAAGRACERAYGALTR